MEPTKAALVMKSTLWYIHASLIYMVAGLGLFILGSMNIISYGETAFFFSQLYGFVAMMIFGISYLFIPAFAHRYLYSLRLIKIQFVLANTAVILMMTAFSGVLPLGVLSRFLFFFPLLLEFLAVLTHAFNLWMTMQGYGVSPAAKLARAAK